MNETPQLLLLREAYTHVALMERIQFQLQELTFIMYMLIE